MIQTKKADTKKAQLDTKKAQLELQQKKDEKMTTRQKRIWQSVIAFVMSLIGAVAGDIANINLLN